MSPIYACDIIQHHLFHLQEMDDLSSVQPVVSGTAAKSDDDSLSDTPPNSEKPKSAQ